MRLAFLVLAACLLLPGLAAAQDLCAGREGCSQGETMTAGRDAGRVQLRVARVSVPSPLDADANPLCNSDLDEYWLLRGSAPPRLVGHVCDGVGISEGIEITTGDNRLTAAFLGGSGMVRTAYSTTYQLSPLRLREVETCHFSTGDHPRWVQTHFDAQTLRGEALAYANPPGADEPSAGDFGCEPNAARQRWVVVPRLALDVGDMQRLGYALGNCSAVIGAGQGYALAGRAADTPEVRVLATDYRSLLIQIIGPRDTSAAAGTPLSGRSRLEVWSADISHILVGAAEDASATHVLIDPDTGEADGRIDGVVPPEVSIWRATLPDGRIARLVFLTYRPGEIEHLPLQFSVVYVAAPGGRERARVATSTLVAGHASTLGESLDISGFTRCAVVGGVLQITDAGWVDAPFEAQTAAGLR